MKIWKLVYVVSAIMAILAILLVVYATDLPRDIYCIHLTHESHLLKRVDVEKYDNDKLLKSIHHLNVKYEMETSESRTDVRGWEILKSPIQVSEAIYACKYGFSVYYENGALTPGNRTVNIYFNTRSGKLEAERYYIDLLMELGLILR